MWAFVETHQRLTQQILRRKKRDNSESYGGDAAVTLRVSRCVCLLYISVVRNLVQSSSQIWGYSLSLVWTSMSCYHVRHNSWRNNAFCFISWVIGPDHTDEDFIRTLVSTKGDNGPTNIVADKSISEISKRTQLPTLTFILCLNYA